MQWYTPLVGSHQLLHSFAPCITNTMNPIASDSYDNQILHYYFLFVHGTLNSTIWLLQVTRNGRVCTHRTTRLISLQHYDNQRMWFNLCCGSQALNHDQLISWECLSTTIAVMHVYKHTCPQHTTTRAAPQQSVLLCVHVHT